MEQKVSFFKKHNNLVLLIYCVLLLCCWFLPFMAWGENNKYQASGFQAVLSWFQTSPHGGLYAQEVSVWYLIRVCAPICTLLIIIITLLVFMLIKRRLNLHIVTISIFLSYLLYAYFFIRPYIYGLVPEQTYLAGWWIYSAFCLLIPALYLLWLIKKLASILFCCKDKKRSKKVSLKQRINDLEQEIKNLKGE